MKRGKSLHALTEEREDGEETDTKKQADAQRTRKNKKDYRKQNTPPLHPKKTHQKNLTHSPTRLLV